MRASCSLRPSHLATSVHARACMCRVRTHRLEKSVHRGRLHSDLRRPSPPMISSRIARKRRGEDDTPPGRDTTPSGAYGACVSYRAAAFRATSSLSRGDCTIIPKLCVCLFPQKKAVVTRRFSHAFILGFYSVISRPAITIDDNNDCRPRVCAELAESSDAKTRFQNDRVLKSDAKVW